MSKTLPTSQLEPTYMGRYKKRETFQMVDYEIFVLEPWPEMSLPVWKSLPIETAGELLCGFDETGKLEEKES